MELTPGTLEAFGLYLVRTSALVLASPILGLMVGFSGYKLTLIFGSAFLMYTTTGVPVEPGLAPLAFAAMALREVLIGLFLAFIVQLAVLAVRVAGAMIGHEMGFAMASQVDPESGIQVPLITRLYENFFLFGLFLVDGHHWLLRALGNSFERAPVGAVEMNTEFAGTIQRLFGEMFAAGLTFAAPVMVLLTLVSILIGLLSRAVPQLNILEIGFSIRISLGLFAMFLFAPLVAPAMDAVYAALQGGLDAALDDLGG